MIIFDYICYLICTRGMPFASRGPFYWAMLKLLPYAGRYAYRDQI